jgi:hypothetical protein
VVVDGHHRDTRPNAQRTATGLFLQSAKGEQLLLASAEYELVATGSTLEVLVCELSRRHGYSQTF